MPCWRSVAPSGLCFDAMINGGYPPVCNLPVLRTFRLSVCCMLWRVCNLQSGILISGWVVVHDYWWTIGLLSPRRGRQNTGRGVNPSTNGIDLTEPRRGDTLCIVGGLSLFQGFILLHWWTGVAPLSVIWQSFGLIKLEPRCLIVFESLLYHGFDGV